MLLVRVYRYGVSTEIRRNGGVSRLSSDISVAKSSSAFQHWADAPPAQVAETFAVPNVDRDRWRFSVQIQLKRTFFTGDASICQQHR